MAKFSKTNKGGRPKGSKNPSTLERDRVAEAMRQRVYKLAGKLMNAQSSLALGIAHLYRIDEIKKGNKTTRSKPILITSQSEIENYLENSDEGQPWVDEDSKAYYFITTVKPDNQAINSLLDRSFGKAKESVELSGTVMTLPQLVSKLNEDK